MWSSTEAFVSCGFFFFLHPLWKVKTDTACSFLNLSNTDVGRCVRTCVCAHAVQCFGRSLCYINPQRPRLTYRLSEAVAGLLQWYWYRMKWDNLRHPLVPSVSCQLVRRVAKYCWMKMFSMGTHEPPCTNMPILYSFYSYTYSKSGVFQYFCTLRFLNSLTIV